MGIGDDSDDLDFIHDLESCFEVKFTDEETLGWHNVEDIFASLKKHYETGSRHNHPIAVAKAFYRLRRCIKHFNPSQKVSPGTRLGEIGIDSVRLLYIKLSVDHKLKHPRLYGGKVHALGMLMMIVGILTSIALLVIWYPSYLLYAIPIVAVGFVLVRFGAWEFPPGCETVGDLAQIIAARNFRSLSGPNTPVRETELWNALLEVISDHTYVPKLEIRPDTLLLQSQHS